MAGNTKAFQKAMNQGHSAAWEQEWEKAAKFYSAALMESPNHPLALSSLGLALFEQSKYEEALEQYQKAASVSPMDPIPQEKIARIYERLGRLNEAIQASMQAAELHLKARSAEKAIDNWVRVLSIQPENVSVRTKLAAVYERLGRREEAVVEYISLASIYQRSGDITQALKLVEHANRIMPENQDARVALSMMRTNQLLPRPHRPRGGTGPMRMASVRQMEGEDDISSNKQLDPIAEARQKAMVQLAELLFDQAEEAAAAPQRARGLAALTRGLADGSSEGADRTRIMLHLGQAIDSLSQGDTNQAVVELEHALNLGLRSPAAYYNLGLLLAETDESRALRYLQQSIKHADFALAAHLLIGQINERAGRWSQAAADYLHALAQADAELVPEDQVDDLLSQYDSLIDEQTSVEDESALQSICNSVSAHLMRPDWRTYLANARNNLPAQPEGSPVLPAAEMVLETRSSQVVEAMLRVRQLADQGYLRSAQEEALYALQFAPTYLPLHVLIGDLLMQDQRTSEAIQKYLVVADLHLVRGEVTRAIRQLKRVTQISPMNLNVRQRLIDLMVSQDQIEQALEEYVQLANIYYHMAELDKARQIYLDALKVAQDSKNNRKWGVELLLKVADIDLQRLNLRQALRIFEQIRTIQPDNRLVRAQIVNINFRLGQEASAMKDLDDFVNLLESTNRQQMAIEFIQELLIEHPDRLDLNRRLADLYIRSNQLPEAIAQLDSAADALLNANRNMEAVNMLETIISLNPPNVDEYRAALESLRREMLRR